MSKQRRGRFAFQRIDRLLHERARLGILTCLAATGGPLAFGEVKELCDLTDGNLSRHLHSLEEAGIIELRREARGGRPQTWVTFTAAGRQRFLDYVEILGAIVQDSAEARREDGRGRQPGWAQGRWVAG